MALVSNIQLQDGSVKPPNLDTNLKYTAAGLTATEAIAVGTVPVSTSGAITVKSANDIRNWIQTTKTDGNVEIYMSNDARPDWALRVAGTADNAFVIANSYGSNCTAQFPAFSIGGAGAVGLGKTGATNILDIAYKNSATGGIQLTETQNSVGAKLIAEATSASIGSTSNHKFGFRVNGTTVAAFNTSTQFGIGTDSPGATLDVRGAAIFNEAGAAVDFRIEGDTEPNLFFVDGSTDAIGMGTATPVDTSRLHVMGTDGNPSATHSADAMLIVENNGNTLIEIATSNTTYGGLNFSDAAAATRGAVLYDHGTGLGGQADSLYFQTAGSIRAVLQSDGDFGIGTLTPAADIHIAGVDDPEIRLQGATDGDPQITFYQGASTCRATIAYQDTNDVFAIDSAGTVQLQAASTTKLTIGDCVGIGTTAPVAACGAQLDIFSAGATTGLMLRTGNTSAASATIRGEGYRNNGDNEQVLQVVGRNSNNSVDLGIFEVAAEAKHCTGKLEFKTFDGSSMTTKMLINSAGQVGIGTASAAAPLHIIGSAGDPSAAHSSGNAQLILENDGQTYLEFATGTTHYSGITFSDDVATRGAVAYDHGTALGGGADSLHFQTAGSLKAVITCAGLLGLGTLSPLYKLESSDSGTGITYPLALTNPDTSTNASGVGIVGRLGRTVDSTLYSFPILALVKDGAWTGSPPTNIDGHLRFYTVQDESSVEQLRIKSNGNVDLSGERLKLGGTTNNGVINNIGSVRINVDSDNDGSSEYFAVGHNQESIDVNNELFRVQENGRVGIGTTGPSTLLELNSSSGPEITIQRNDTSISQDDVVGGIRFSSNDTSTDLGSPPHYGAGIKAVAEGTVGFQALKLYAGQDNLGYENDTPNMALWPSGDVFFYNTTPARGMTWDASASSLGIGTATPAKALSVVGDAVFDGPTQSSISSGASRPGAVLNLDGNYEWSPGYTGGDYNGQILFNTSDTSGNGAGVGAAIRSMAGDPYGRYFLDFHTTGNDATEGNDALRMRITHSGNIGIGTGTPVALSNQTSLTINGTSVGRVDVKAGGSGGGALFGTSNTLAVEANSGAQVYLNSAASQPIRFLVNSDEKARISSAGNFGIGTTTPAYKIEIAAGDNTEGLAVTASSGDAYLHTSGQIHGYQKLDVESAGLQIKGFSDGGGTKTQTGRIYLTQDSAGSAGGEFRLYLNDGSSVVERLRVDKEGNVGIGVTPSAWRSTETALQVDRRAALYADSHVTTALANNLIINSGGYALIEADAASQYYQYQGAHVWQTVGSGSAGANVSPSTVMVLSSAGNLGLGTSAPLYPFDVRTSSNHRLFVRDSSTNSGAEVQIQAGNDADSALTNLKFAADNYFFEQGNVNIGTSGRGNVFYEGGHSAALQVEGTTASKSGISLIRNNAQYGPSLILARSCGTSVGSNTLVATGQGIGGINFQANDGTDFVQAAYIAAKVGNHAASNCMSGELQFATSDGTNGSVIERMRIHEDGRVAMGTTATCIARLTSQSNISGDFAFLGITTVTDRGPAFFCNTNGSFNDTMLTLASGRASTTAYDFARYNNTTSMVYKVEGDGGVSSDSGFTTPAADYGEYFESSTGESSEIGRSVVLDGGKVRYYNSETDSAENIIGVTRPKLNSKNSGFVGNAAWSYWQDKYLTDDWGVYIYETTTVWEWSVETESGSETHSAYERDELAKDPSWTPPEGAVSSSQSVRKLNPDYDESLDSGYQPRDSRDEWWLIGLLGQVPIKSGEPVNPRWIKMKDISAAVEYYYIR